MKYNKKIIGILIMFGLITPQLMFATPIGNKGGENFCANLDNFLANSENKLSERDAKQNANFTERIEKLDVNRMKKDSEINSKIAEALAKQDAKFTEMLEKANTPKKKQAILNFQTTVKDLVKVRQKAIDNARDMFRNGIDQIISNRKSEIDNALTTMKTTIESAVVKAKMNCISSTDKESVKTTLKNSVQAARETMKNTIQSLVKINNASKTLTEVRETTFKKAHNDFKTALEEAKMILKSQLSTQ